MDPAATGKTSWYADADNDGVGNGSAIPACDAAPSHPVKTTGDCDDTNAAIKPGATEVCDAGNVDEDCDGKADDADTAATGKTKFFADKDADGHGAGAGALQCDASAAFGLTTADDCNDAAADVHPGATEVCDVKNIDEDCNGKADDADASATGKTSYYADKDFDKYGAGDAHAQCDASAAYTVTANGDCNDAKAGIHPGAAEVCDTANVDEDCDGRSDDSDDGATGKTSFYADSDKDTIGAGDAFAQCDASDAHPVTTKGDCNDKDAAIKPGATEVCDANNVDEDCDGKADDADTAATGKTSFYADRDQDGAGSGVAYARCDASSTATATVAGDCNDTNAGVHPGATEVCDAANLDEDCNGKADNADPAATGKTSFYADADADSHGAGTAVAQCDATPAAKATNNDDCDDAKAGVHPGATEVCDANNIDEDCNGKADNADAAANGKVSFYKDGDKDAIGGGEAFAQCDASDDYSVKVGGDCNDKDAAIKPGATEACDANNVDEDCDGKADDADSTATGKTPFYADRDKDGIGAGTAYSQCDASTAAPVSVAGDCNDANAAVHPGASEVCDTANLDEDCNGKADNADPAASGKTAFYADADADTHGGGSALMQCDATPAAKVTSSDDCDDTRASVHPGAKEVCDATNLDEDCNGKADDADSAATGKTAFYTDSDKDTFGGATTQQCDASSDYPVKLAGDCDDKNAAINPKATEVCDSGDVDEDCDGKSDNGDTSATGKTAFYADKDADSYGTGAAVSLCDATPAANATVSGDCNDTIATVNPGGREVCDPANLDEDCDGKADNNDADSSGTIAWYGDADKDGYGSGAAAQLCDADLAHTTSKGNDCNDTNKVINPGALEVCDAANVDEDCDNVADDLDDSVSPTTKTTFYRDADSDKFGKTDAAEQRCDIREGYAAAKDDCDDKAAHVYPGAPELCDDAYNNCTTSASWSAATEAGSVSVKAKDGVWTDLRKTFTSGGTFAAPADSELWFCPGDYTGHITVAEGPVRIESRSTAQNTSLNGGSVGSVIEIASAAPGAILVHGLKLTGGNAEYGGAIYMRGKGTLTVEVCDISGNQAKIAGAGIYATKASAITIRDSVFTKNRSTGAGGAIAAHNEVLGGKLEIIGSTFKENATATYGGGVDVNGWTTTLSGSTFSANTANNGGGIVCRGASCTFSTTTFTDNKAGAQGGAMYLASPAKVAATIDGVAATGNRATGGAALFVSGPTLKVTASQFTGNAAETTGGAILIDTGAVTLSNTTLETNVAGGAGGGNGGAVYLSTGTLTIEKSTLTGNSARPGPAKGNGGAIYAPGGSMSIVESTLSKNAAAATGGAIFAAQATVVLDGSTLRDNTAARGGAIYQTGAASMVTAKRTSILANTAKTAMPLSAQGGGWFLSAGARGLLDASSVIAENLVTTDGLKDTIVGGGVAAFGDATQFSCNNSTITTNHLVVPAANTTGSNGGGAYVGDGAARLLSASCDWGTSATENAPNDVWLDGLKGTFAYTGTSSVFSCAGDAVTCE